MGESRNIDMCGRYYVDDDTAREIEKVVREVDAKIKKDRTGDISPSQSAVVITGKAPGLLAEEMIWGFPQYQKHGLLINARAETALERQTFRQSILSRRCIIPAKHFYEWSAAKDKVTFYRKDNDLIYMAGFYNQFQGEERFIILTTQANASVRKVHDRMPLILEKGELDNWVYDDNFINFALHKEPIQLEKLWKTPQKGVLQNR